MSAITLRKNTILADASRSSRSVQASRATVRVGRRNDGTVVRTGIETTAVLGAPAWWPKALSWPPSLTPPANWDPSTAWPPMTVAEMNAGIGALTNPGGAGAGIPITAEVSFSPATKDLASAGVGAVLGGVIAKLAIGGTLGPIAAGAAVGAILGHVAYALATGNSIAAVATKGCGCGGPPSAKEWPSSTASGARFASAPGPTAAKRKMSGGKDYDAGVAAGRASGQRRERMALSDRETTINALAARFPGKNRQWLEGFMDGWRLAYPFAYPSEPVKITIENR